MYTITYQSGVAKQMRRLSPSNQVKVAMAINALADNPRPHGSKKLRDRDNQYRIRAGDYRVVYTIYDRIVTVEIIEVGHRRDIYR